MVLHFEDAALEARAAAFLADEFDVREKLHFDGDGAVALAGFAAAAGNVERKVAGGVAAALGVRSVGENVANGVEGFQIRSRIGTRGAADGRLVDDDGFANVSVAIEAIAKFLFRAAGFLGIHRTEQHVMNQRGFARRSEEHTSELQSHVNLVCRLLLEKKKKKKMNKSAKNKALS